MVDTGEDDRDILKAQASLVRERSGLGRSASLVALFDYLLKTSLEGRAPKEIEIASAVFDRQNDFDSMQDASIRVYVFRLRKKLEEFYAGEGASQPQRIVMLKGEYRLIVQPNGPQATAPLIAPEPDTQRPAASVRMPWLAARLKIIGTIVASAALGAAAWALLSPTSVADRQLAEARTSKLWSFTTAEGAPLVVAIGDYYIFGEVDARGNINRLVRDFSINSRYDLDNFMIRSPENAGHFIDVGLNYYPTGVANALRDIIPILRTETRSLRPIRIVPVSQLTPHMIRTSNIVYIGYFSGLGSLRDALFTGSRFSMGGSYDELVDKRSGKDFAASGTGNGTLEDLGYIASFAGPAQNRIVIIAGTRDAGLMQAADYASRVAKLRDVDEKTGKNGSFEALMRVVTLNGENLSGEILSLSPFNDRGIWNGTPPQQFPDQP